MFETEEELEQFTRVIQRLLFLPSFQELLLQILVKNCVVTTELNIKCKWT